MRMRRMIAPLVLVLAALPAQAQETRGNINGIVQDKGGVIPGAVVTVRNTDTGQTLPLVTNGRGYFEALLLNPGTYSVQVELAGYKGYTQTDITLAVGQTVSLTVTLEVGQVTEQITVVASAPLLDTTTVSSGQNFDRRMVEGLPMFSNMPIMLSRFAVGVVPGTAEAEVINVFQGYMEGTTAAAGGQLGTGSGFDNRNTGNNYTIDGAQNNGFGRRHCQLAQFRPDRGGPHRNVELRCVAGARDGAQRLDDDARGHEYAARLGQLHALAQPPELTHAATEGDLQAGSAYRKGVEGGPRTHRRLHAGRAARHPEDHRRARQGVLLRQLLDVERLGARPPGRQLHGACEPEAPRRRFLGPAAVALGRRGHHAGGPPPVPDLRSPDDEA